jgi:hypothetical protein
MESETEKYMEHIHKLVLWKQLLFVAYEVVEKLSSPTTEATQLSPQKEIIQSAIEAKSSQNY